MCGMGRTFITKEIAAGRLKAFTGPNSHGPSKWKYLVARNELVRWLLAARFDLHYLRKLLNNGKGKDLVVLVRARAGLQTRLMAGKPTIRLDSLFSLGQAVRDWVVSAVVVDLAEVGTAEATRSLADFARQVDRPVLIGLYDDTCYPRAETAEVFDFLFPLSRSDDALVASIKATIR